MFDLDAFGYVPDFIGKVNSVTWAIEVKSAHVLDVLSFDKMAQLGKKYQFQTWMIVFGKTSHKTKENAKRYGFYITFDDDWNKLNKILRKNQGHAKEND